MSKTALNLPNIKPNKARVKSVYKIDKILPKSSKLKLKRSNDSVQDFIQDRKTILLKMNGNQMPISSVFSDFEGQNTYLKPTKKLLIKKAETKANLHKNGSRVKEIAIGTEDAPQIIPESPSFIKELVEAKIGKFSNSMKKAGNRNRIIPAERLNSTFKKFKKILKSRSVARTRVREIEKDEFEDMSYNQCVTKGTVKPPVHTYEDYWHKKMMPFSKVATIHQRNLSVENPKEKMNYSSSGLHKDELQSSSNSHYIATLNTKEMPISEIRKELVEKLLNTNYSKKGSPNPYDFAPSAQESHLYPKNLTNALNGSIQAYASLPSKPKANSKAYFFKYKGLQRKNNYTKLKIRPMHSILDYSPIKKHLGSSEYLKYFQPRN
ncbi:unnamed protein product [Moneuplotes crassus]|uniref:Uncharacterized protein n=1 Tax=Euplotes crassus TaxID=5936 RepID=A0AAD1XEY3_EUPCR|nr:unnamed protein product [Moneuplotes crassus]